MSRYYLDAGTTYSKIIEIADDLDNFSHVVFHKFESFIEKQLCHSNIYYYVIPSKLLKTLDVNFEKTCGHMAGEYNENEIVALANGCKDIVDNNATILDLGSRDAKWIRFKDAKFKDMDWNTSCASSTGATVEMLLKFYDVRMDELVFNQTKFPVVCGIFGLEKIMDDISNGVSPPEAISKFIHGIAYNSWSFAKKPQKIYLSGGFCDSVCFVDSLKNYCEVELLGRFLLCEGLIGE